MADTKARLAVLKELHKEQEELYEEGNTRYGDSFHTTYEEHGPVVAVIRLEDKLNRIKSMVKNDLDTSGGESLQDTLADLSNYANMFLIELRGVGSVTEAPKKSHKKRKEAVPEVSREEYSHGPLDGLTKAQLVEVANKLGATLPRKVNREKLYKIINGFNLVEVVTAITEIVGDTQEDNEDGEAE